MNNDSGNADWLYFSEALVPEWCREAEAQLKAILGFDIGVELTLPSEDDAKWSLETRVSLTGTLTLKAGERSIALNVRLPFDGVFFHYDQERRSLQKLVWANWLTERPGVRCARASNGVKEYRLGFPDGSELAVKLSGKQPKGYLNRALKNFRINKFRELWKFDRYPAWLRDILDEALDSVQERKTDKEAFCTAIDSLGSAIKGHAKDLPVSDADDLKHRVLVSFPRWLIFNLCKCICITKTKEKLVDVDSLFKWLGEHAESFGDRLVSLGRLAKAKPSGRFAKSDPSVLIRANPVNVVELMALLTGVKRFRFSRKSAALVQARRRQNHESFARRLCPLESPESELIGLQLQLARGARVSADGLIIKSTSENMLDRLGWGTSLIPFLNHNDGARDMMGAKNLRQAVAITGREPPSVKTGTEDELAKRTARLVNIGACPNSTSFWELALGRDLLVAYMPWYGWNVEDAVVLRRGTAKDMAFAQSIEVEKNVPDGQIIRKIKSKVTKTYPLGLGDKLMGRHGNKGVVARLVDDDEMPQLPDNAKIPEALRGKRIDILLNPHGILSRMNPGQLLETHIGWLLHAGVPESELLEEDSPKTAVGDSAAKLDHAKIRRLLEENGLDRNGAIPLNLGDGRRTANPVVVGYQYFVRLNHVPGLKSQARRGGENAKYSLETHQAVRGRKVGGGQRLGEMEIWALAAYGANAILQEMLGVKSDRDLALGGKNGMGKSPEDVGFARVMGDWLFSFGVDMKVEKDKCKFRILSKAGDFLKKIGNIRAKSNDHLGAEFEVSNKSDLQLRQIKTFGLDGKPMFDMGFPVKEKQDTLRLGDFLEASGYRRKGLLRKVEPDANGRVSYQLSFVDIGGDLGFLQIAFSRGAELKKSSNVDVSFHKANGSPLALMGRESLTFFYETKERVIIQEAFDNATKAAETVDHLLDNARLRHCEKTSKSITAIPDKDGACVRHGVPGSIYDKWIFGPLQSPSSDGWGYIRLARPVLHPYLGSELTIIPVLPLCYRMPRHDSKIGGDARKLNECYKDIIKANKANDGKAEKQLNMAVRKLFATIRKRLDGKDGLLRHEGLGRRVDRSFRLVIVPDPNLEWNQVGVPASILWEILGDEIQEWQKKERQPRSVALAFEPELHRSNPGQETLGGDISEYAADQVARIFPDRSDAELSWPRTDISAASSGVAVDKLINGYIASHPDTLVLLNRQPSLHMYSFQAFHPVATSDEEGDVLRLPPFCCKGFAADFDGDEMTGHLPLSAAAREEAVRLLPENNLLSIAADTAMVDYTRDTLLDYTRDLVSGLQFVYKNQGEKSIKDDLDEFDNCCLSILHGHYTEDGSFGQALLKHLFHEHSGADTIRLVRKWAQLAWKACSEVGFSFGFYDLQDLAKEAKQDILSETDFPEELRKRVKGVLKRVRDAADNHDADTTSGMDAIARMVLLGANGRDQAYQEIARRGRLPDLPDKTPSISASLVGGMDWEELFTSSWNARMSMCDKKLETAKAGGLTRKLVLALWPLMVADEEDCGCDRRERSPLTCRLFDEKRCFCRKCYGPIPANLQNTGMEIPVGLIAALSIGERGTQLAMKSIHGIDGIKNGVKLLRAFLKGGCPAERDCREGGNGAPAAFEEFHRAVTGTGQGENSYSELDKRHFMVLWRAWRAGWFNSPCAGQDGWTTFLQGFHLEEGKERLEKLVELAGRSQGLSVETPLAKVLFNLFQTKE